jgi:hypothetical protein
VLLVMDIARPEFKERKRRRQIVVAAPCGGGRNSLDRDCVSFAAGGPDSGAQHGMD